MKGVKYGCNFSVNNNAAALRGGNRYSLVSCDKGNPKKIIIRFEGEDRRYECILLHNLYNTDFSYSVYAAS